MIRQERFISVTYILVNREESYEELGVAWVILSFFFNLALHGKGHAPVYVVDFYWLTGWVEFSDIHLADDWVVFWVQLEELDVGVGKSHYDDDAGQDSTCNRADLRLSLQVESRDILRETVKTFKHISKVPAGLFRPIGSQVSSTFERCHLK